ncbi:hypothetical protein PTTG_26736 [Puccinia triticina 1-1 BBBD Race 1]|uniref:Helitron_like_N domain-containing protein n=1 Tax=Puccinia triticina (isolate 1-1 / race 1 (BBBD)) TaxID=630390 RepID=A0A180GT91_PUCT1|nr:hypothetical protein PTTG_26736 [Puccinia triticina 1-1 BBBD Race 1]
MVGIPQKAVRSAAKNCERALKAAIEFTLPHTFGRCDRACVSCGALHWTEEASVADRPKSSISFSSCCQKDKVTIPAFDKTAKHYPSELRKLLEKSHPTARNFQRLIRMYNNAVSFTLLRAKVDHSVQGPKGVTVFRMHGGLAHLISSIEPIEVNNPGYAQIYVVGDGGTNEAELRIAKAQGKAGITGKGAEMMPKTVATILQVLYRINPYAKFFKSAREVLSENTARTFKLQGVPLPGSDPKRYNKPTVDEIAVVVEGEGDIIKERQILLHRKNGILQMISNMHSSYFPLWYPLFFPRGEQQWDSLYQAWTRGGRKVGSLEWYAYLLFQRVGRFSPILAGRSLLQELIVDMYVCVERQRLQYISSNQERMKAAQYKKLVESLENNQTATGRRVILPSTFIGGPRNMTELYYDAMSICNKLGPPSLFITMTANPAWPEILACIPKDDKAFDHPTIVARVFNMKVKALITELVTNRRLGRVLAFIYTIEFQKRDRPVTPEDVDLLVTAKYLIPMKNQICTPSYLSSCYTGPAKDEDPFTPRTVTLDGAYPAYKRRKDGHRITKYSNTFDSGSVVPYNKFLTLMFECHINVELPVNTTAIKYLYKYITKGHNRAYMAVEIEDETKAFVDARYISPPEACWRLFKFSLSDRSPAVTRLGIHNQNEQLVYFKSSDGAKGQINSGRATQTTLTGYMKLNRDNAMGADNRPARSLLYADIPTYFWWDKAKREWIPRKSKTDAVGRIHAVSYLAGEKFYLRILLLHVKGATSFRSLRTVAGCKRKTY